MPVSITIRSARAAYLAFAHVATVKQQHPLANFIIRTGDVESILELLQHRKGQGLMLEIAFTTKQLRRIAQMVCERGNASDAMECFARLPAEEVIAQSRMLLLERLLREPIKFWLKGDKPDFNVHPLFRKAKFLPAEVELMIAKVKRSGNHEYVDALADFKVGMLANAQWEGLQHLAAYLRRLKEAREQQKKKTA
jgi:hypothetical protein